MVVFALEAEWTDAAFRIRRLEEIFASGDASVDAIRADILKVEDVQAAGLPLVVLVGDESYYGRFGFTPVPPGQITLPGPVAPTRLLAVELIPGKLSTFQGLIVGKRV